MNELELNETKLKELQSYKYPKPNNMEQFDSGAVKSSMFISKFVDIFVLFVLF